MIQLRGEGVCITTESDRMPYFNPDESVVHLRGNLPHWRQGRVTYFVTFRTHDSIPQVKLREWHREHEAWVARHPEPRSPGERSAYNRLFSDRLQEWLDAGYGECVLRQTRLRTIVEQALRRFDGQRYDLDEFVVVPNHVHALVTPSESQELSRIIHSWKSYTANEINRRLGRKGKFWQKESFDHMVRSPGHLEYFRRYIRNHRQEE